MQNYQFNKIQESGDEPLDDDTRILQAEDIDRYIVHVIPSLITLFNNLQTLKFKIHQANSSLFCRLRVLKVTSFCFFL